MGVLVQGNTKACRAWRFPGTTVHQQTQDFLFFLSVRFAANVLRAVISGNQRAQVQRTDLITAFIFLRLDQKGVQKESEDSYNMGGTSETDTRTVLPSTTGLV